MLQCPICLGILNEPVSAPCGHVFCCQCLKAFLRSCKRLTPACPTCRSPFSTSLPANAPASEYESSMLSTLRKIYLPELDNNSTWIQELEKRAEELEEDRSRLRGQLHDATETIRQQEEQIARLRFKLSTLEAKKRREVRDWESSCDDLKEEVDGLKRRMKRIHLELEGEHGSKAPKSAARAAVAERSLHGIMSFLISFRG